MKPNYDIRFLYIDLFCGAGGTSTGIERARRMMKKIALVIACVNHDRNAIASHKANHPHAVHYTEDIRTLDLTELTAHVMAMRMLYPNAKVILWASLECTHHSKAKGGQSRDADSRSLAEHLHRYITALNPDGIQIENVVEFLTWGPLMVKVKNSDSGHPCCPLTVKTDKKTKRKWLEPTWVPDPTRKSEYFNKWRDKIQDSGYRYDDRIINAADLGARTSRSRYFGMFASGDLPIVFPRQTHAKNPNKHPGKNYKKWRAVKPLLELEKEGVSIFDRKKEVAEASKMRIYEGAVAHVAGGQKAFIERYNAVKKESINTEIRQVDGAVGYLVKAFSGDPRHKNISLSEPCGSVTTVDHHQLIQTEPYLAMYYGNGYTRSVDEPSPTLTAKDRVSVIKAETFIEQQFGKNKCSSIDKVLGCITTNPKYRKIKCKPWLHNPQYKSKDSSVDYPCFTLIARMDKAPPSLVNPRTATDRLPSFIVVEGNMLIYHIYDNDSPATKKLKEFMWLYGLVDIKMRMLNETELKRIMELKDNYILIGKSDERKKYIGNMVHPLVPKLWCETLDETMEIQRLQAA